MPFKFLQPLGKYMESWNIKNANLVFSINQKLKDYTIKMGALPGNTVVLRAGVDATRFSPGVSGADMRRQYGLKDDDIVLFFVGWLYHFSGLKEVAMALAGNGDEKLKLFVVGDGDAYADLQKIRTEDGLKDRIILTGKQPYERLPELMAVADFFLLPAYNNEIMRNIVPIKMYESLAMGRPVLASKLPGIMAEFGEGNGVFYVDRPEDVIKVALDLYQGGKTAEAGSQARKFVEQNSGDNITDEFEKILEEAMESSKLKRSRYQVAKDNP
jgi:glycosyltransferase involved in cell wall biosynthesis